jgi:hypothetical protein
VNAVLGGWMMGYAMAIVSTISLTYLAIQPSVHKFIQKYLDIPGLMFAVPLSIGTAFMWTMIGMMLGSLYELGNFKDEPGIAGAPSWVFLFIISALAWLPLPVLYLFSRRFWWMWVGTSLCFIGLFGWAMPILAES